MNVRCAWWNTASSLEAQTDGARRKKCFSSQLPNRDHRLQRLPFHLNNVEHIFTQARRKTCASVFKTGLWSSGQADRCIWAAVITPRCYSEVASIQEVLLPVLLLCCCCVAVVSRWDSAGERTTSDGLLWSLPSYTPPALCMPNTHLNPQPTSHNPQPPSVCEGLCYWGESSEATRLWTGSM